ncbi:hypothetical protein [Pseudoclavibacter sp. AY1F1]|uniref:hypothetical protein n=1 Tax=Pseudoclavibacter sp. AY1F1 TaxID=2080583 RepID=UPI0011B05E81|nr:hypothetical protein [Pseudoclavibacter sp. AY1F1]
MTVVALTRSVVTEVMRAGIVWQPVYEIARAPLALVPGNIGDVGGLVDAVRGISYQRSSAE